MCLPFMITDLVEADGHAFSSGLKVEAYSW